MLNSLPLVEANETVYRFANQRGDIENLERRGLDSEATEEMLAFLASAGSSVSPDELLSGPLCQKPQLDAKYVDSTRFSDGSWRVFYSAIEQNTAEREATHYHVRRALGDPSKRRTVYFSYFNCRFQGGARDLRPRLGEWPLLVHDSDLSFCQDLGREAVEMGIDGFFAPSARQEGGTTVPVFKRAALSDPNILGFAAFSIDPESGELRTAYSS